MPFLDTDTNSIQGTLYLYMEPISSPDSEPYFYTSEYERSDMILVHTWEMAWFKPDGFDPTGLSVLAHQKRATDLRVLAQTSEDKAENLLALPAPMDIEPEVVSGEEE